MITTPPPQASSGSAVSVRVALATAGVLLLLTGCSGSSAPGDARLDTGAGAAKASMKVALITHGGEGDAFWELVRKGRRTPPRRTGSS